MADEEIFSTLVVTSWKPRGGSEINFPCHRITEIYGNRLAPRKRPYRDGSKLDDIGADHIGWELECLFHNQHDEPDLPDDLYPTQLNKLCDSAKIHDTGDLTLSTRGPRRARFKDYRRTESDDQRDTAAVTLTFWEDNEDDVTAASFQNPTFASAGRRLVQQALFECQKAGIWNADVASLSELASGLEALAEAPGDFVDSINERANQIINKVRQVERAFTNAGNRGASEAAKLLLHPEASMAGRALRRLADAAARATTNLVGSPRIVTRTYPRVVSIFDVATELEQDGARLMAINPKIGDPLAIPPRTPIRVFDLS